MAVPTTPSSMGSYTELVSRYGIEPTPESVRRLTQLLAQQDSDLDEIARLIDRDPTLRQRLLRAANSGAAETGNIVETVEEALMRNGIGCALLMAMGAPLSLALAKTFRTMLSLKLESIDLRKAPPLESKYLLATIRFMGKAVGRVSLRMNIGAGAAIAGTLLGVQSTEVTPGLVNDTVGELVNIITGNFKSNLSDAGLNCRLEPPLVTRTDETFRTSVPGGGLERMAFKAGDLIVFVDVAVNPWNDGD